MRRLLAAVLLALAPLAFAAPLVVGVQTHFGQDSSVTDVRFFREWMMRAGLNSSRDEMYWSQVEDRAGKFALRQAAARSAQAWATMPAPFAGLLILDYGHPGHDGGGQPKSDAARNAFARYAEFAASQVAGRVRWLELWNEWNHASPPDRGDAGEYVALARTVYPALKRSYPGMQVIAGSPADDLPDWPWMRQAIKQGLLGHTDGIAVHLYNHCARAGQVGSDGLARGLDALRAIVTQAGYPAMPFYVTEVGWPTHRGSCGVSEDATGAHTLRFLLEASVRPWVAGVWLYEFQDGGDNAAEPEHRFGLLRRDGTEKPAGCALRELGARLAQRPFALFRGDGSAAAAFRNGSSDRWLVWARESSQRAVSIKLESAAPASFTSPVLCGLPAADMQFAPNGRSATVRLAPRSVHVIDVPAGAQLNAVEGA
jgi:hypothetical protein